MTRTEAEQGKSRRPLLAGIVGLMSAVAAAAAQPVTQPAGVTTAPASPTAGPASAPTTEPAATLEGMREAAVKAMQERTKDLAAGPAIDPDASFSIRVQDRLLGLTTTLPDTDGDVRVAFTDDPQLSGMVQVRRDPEQGPGGSTVPRAFTLFVARFDLPGVIQSQVQMSTLGTRGELRLAYTVETMAETVDMQLIQQPSDDPEEMPFKVYINVSDRSTDERVVDRRLMAESFAELRRKHPLETARYIRPGFEQIGQARHLFAIDERTAWQVLGSEAVGPPAGLAERLKEVLPRLESAKFAEREAAQKELRTIGQPAALALRGWDRGKLSAQQNAEVDAFLAEYMGLPPAEVDAQRSNSDFLLDCLLLDEPVLRAAAWERLKVAAPELRGFDPAAPQQVRQRWAGEARRRLFQGPTSRPATAPSTEPVK